MRLLLAVALVVSGLLAGCTAGTPGAVPLPLPIGSSSEYAFSAALVPSSAAVSEPSIGIAPNGHVFISGPTGLPSASQMWQSNDNGATWTRNDPNPTKLGGGDTSIAIGPDGAIYVTDLYAGSSTISSSHDDGKTWFNQPIADQVPFDDREWNTVDAQNVAYYLGRNFAPGAAAFVSKSTDGGKTWIHVGQPWNQALPGDANNGGQDGAFLANLATGQLGVVYTCGPGSNYVCVSTSAKGDGGVTWNPVVAAKPPGNPGNDFPALAVDTAGNWYVAYSANVGDAMQVFLTTSKDAKAWTPPVQVTSGDGLRMFPWMVAGDEGRIAIGWYDAKATGDVNDVAKLKDAVWDMKAAMSTNALDAKPSFDIVTVMASVHKGTISTQGFNPGSQNPPDRSLGDFFTMAVDPQGMVHYAFMTGENGKVALAHAIQTKGPSLYVSGHAPAAGKANAPSPLLPATLPLP